MSEIEKKRGFWSRLLGSDVQEAESAEEVLELLGAELAATKEIAHRLSVERDAAVRAGELRAQDLATALTKATSETDALRKAARQQVAAAKRDTEAARLDVAAARKELEATRHELTRVRAELQASDKAVAEARARVSHGEDDLAEARGLLGRTRRQLQELEQELADVRTEAMSARGAAASASTLAQLLQATLIRALVEATGSSSIIALRKILREEPGELPSNDEVLAFVAGANKLVREPRGLRLSGFESPPSEAACSSARFWTMAFFDFDEVSDEWSGEALTILRRER
jgi:chromosome segregation ATPase